MTPAKKDHDRWMANEDKAADRERRRALERGEAPDSAEPIGPRDRPDEEE